MENTADVSTKSKIWEMINPFIYCIVCLIICTAVVQMIFSGIAIANEDVAGIYRATTASTLTATLVFYVVTVILKRKTCIYDKFKYGHESKHLPVWKLVIAVAICFFVAFVADKLIDMSRIGEIFTGYSSNTTFDGQSPVLMILATVIFGPIAEEIIFRWMIYGRMRFYLGKKWAVVLSAILFGLYHGNMVQFIYCTILGIVFAIAYEKSGNIFVTIIAHMLINLEGIIAILQLI